MRLDKQRLLQAIFGVDTKKSIGDNALNEILSELEPRYIFILQHRYGNHSTPIKTIAAICPRADGNVGVTTERVRQLEHAALRKLKHPSRIRRLCRESKD